MDQTAQIAHLLRRAGFGPTAAELAQATSAGYSSTVGSLVAGLGQPDQGADAIAVPTLTPPPANYATFRSDVAARRAFFQSLLPERRTLTTWWLSRMTATTNPLQEKLTFLLHGHFPTGISKVRFPFYMYGQNQVFRTLGGGNFDTLTQAVSADPAMLIWLDASSDKASNPNENFARELMERFTMGIGTYSEQDVRAAAYCFTGWRLDAMTNKLVINQGEHSTTPQVVLGNSGVTSGQQVIDIVTGTAASSRYVPAALWSHLAYPVSTTDPVVSDLAPSYSQDHNVANLLRAIFTHPAFISSQATGGLIKQPTEYVVGALRAFGATLTGLPRGDVLLQSVLAGLGQVLFDPPSVGGWAQNEYWLSTAAALTRWKFATYLARTADISAVTDAPAASRVDAVANALSVPSWSASTAAALSRAATDPQTLVTLALVSPEYVSN